MENTPNGDDYKYVKTISQQDNKYVILANVDGQNVEVTIQVEGNMTNLVSVNNVNA